MLVLSRYIDEVITIGDDIRIRIVDIRGGGVRIGIEAPRSVAVHREEVYEAIKAAANNPVTKTIASVNSGTNVRSIAVPTIAARKEVVPMT
jgi:carbon storage regulator